MGQSCQIILVIVLIIVIIAFIWTTMAQRAKTCRQNKMLIGSSARPSAKAYAQAQSVPFSQYVPGAIPNAASSYQQIPNVAAVIDNTGLASGRTTMSPLVATDGTLVEPYSASNAASEAIAQPELFKAFTEAPEGVSAKMWPTNIDGTAENMYAAVLPGGAKNAAEVQRRYVAASAVNTYLEGANYISAQNNKKDTKYVGAQAGATFDLFAEYMNLPDVAKPIIDCDKISHRFLPENHPCYEAVVQKLKAEEAAQKQGITGFGSIPFRDMNQRH